MHKTTPLNGFGPVVLTAQLLWYNYLVLQVQRDKTMITHPTPEQP